MRKENLHILEWKTSIIFVKEIQSQIEAIKKIYYDYHTLSQFTSQMLTEGNNISLLHKLRTLLFNYTSTTNKQIETAPINRDIMFIEEDFRLLQNILKDMIKALR